MSESTVILTTDNFDETLKNTEGAVLVDFWAEWCGPCKAVAPILDEIAAENQGKITIAKLNVDDHPQISARFGIQSIPTMMVFQNGEPAQPPIIGARPKAQIIEALKNFL